MTLRQMSSFTSEKLDIQVKLAAEVNVIPKLLTVRETAEALHLSVGVVRQRILHRKIRYIKLDGGEVRVPASEIKRILLAGSGPAIPRDDGGLK